MGTTGHHGLGVGCNHDIWVGKFLPRCQYHRTRCSDLQISLHSIHNLSSSATYAQDSRKNDRLLRPLLLSWFQDSSCKSNAQLLVQFFSNLPISYFELSHCWFHLILIFLERISRLSNKRVCPYNTLRLKKLFHIGPIIICPRNLPTPIKCPKWTKQYTSIPNDQLFLFEARQPCP